jgi:hypothetical protein
MGTEMLFERRRARLERIIYALYRAPIGLFIDYVIRVFIVLIVFMIVILWPLQLAFY